MTDVMAQKTDGKLRQLSDHFVDSVLKPPKPAGGKTPAVTPFPRASSMAITDIMTDIELSLRNDQD